VDFIYIFYVLKIKGSEKMGLSINTSYPCNSDNYAKCTSRDIKYIVIHYVGATGSALENAKYFNSHIGTQASAHYFVGHASENAQIYQSVKNINRAWHCGGTTYYHDTCRNANSIGIEMCCHKDAYGNWYFDDETVNVAIELTILLMKQYNIGIDNILMHWHITHKSCPDPFVKNPNAWKDFKNKIKKGLVDMAIEKWMEDVGIKALDNLSKKDIINNAEDWKKKLDQYPQNWLFFEMLNRLTNRIDQR